MSRRLIPSEADGLIPLALSLFLSIATPYEFTPSSFWYAATLLIPYYHSLLPFVISQELPPSFDPKSGNDNTGRAFNVPDTNLHPPFWSNYGLPPEASRHCHSASHQPAGPGQDPRRRPHRQWAQEETHYRQKKKSQSCVSLLQKEPYDLR